VQRRIRTRRLLNFIHRNVVHGTSWAVFEPRHDERVWTRIAADLDDLLSLLWRSGALVGDTPEDAYSVRCDAETNPPETQFAGQIIAECTISPEPDLQLPFRVVYFSD
jgi:hypothetical protein